MTLTDTDRLRAAHRLISAAGASFDDQHVVHDAGIGYADGNYPLTGDVWVTGDWNNRTEYRDGTRVVIDDMPERLASALERLGVSTEWHDENDRCGDCAKLIRTQPDSYAWTAQYLIDENAGDFICRECAMSDPESLIADNYANDHRRALTWLTVHDLTALGWVDAFPDQHDAQRGFHPGQDAQPSDMVDAWREANPDSTDDYVFVITDKGQFDMSFRMMVHGVDDE